MDYSVVIPVYNERDNLEILLKSLTMNGDMQNDPRDIPKLLKQIGDYDVVCGRKR